MKTQPSRIKDGRKGRRAVGATILRPLQNGHSSPERECRFVPRGLIWEEASAELVEAAIVLPLLLSLLIGIFWLGRAYNIYATITRAAREGARLAVAPTCATCGNAFATDAEVQSVINAALAASALDPSRVNPAITIERNQILNPNDPMQSRVAGVIVRFGYPVQVAIPFTSLRATSFTITTQVQMRQEF